MLSPPYDQNSCHPWQPTPENGLALVGRRSLIGQPRYLEKRTSAAGVGDSAAVESDSVGRRPQNSTPLQPTFDRNSNTAVFLVAGFLFACDILRTEVLQSLGGMCGAMTSTAGMGAVTSKTDCDIPVASYAAAYPAALVMMTIVAQLPIGMLR